MTPFKNTQELQIFLQEIKKIFPYEREASMNLLYSLITNAITNAKTVVELTLNRYFQREYSSLYKALKHYYAPRAQSNALKEKRAKIRTQIENYLCDKVMRFPKSKYSFCLDMTGNLSSNAKKMPDRSYIYSNGQVGIGHLYSAICLNAGEGWMLPISMLRVPSTDNKMDFAIYQMQTILNRVNMHALIICVGDSGYCCNKFIYSINQNSNAVTILIALEKAYFVII